MKNPTRFARIEAALLHSSELGLRGVQGRELQAQVARGSLVRVARGWFVGSATWSAWFPGDRHLASVIAAHRNANTPPLFSHHSAAVLLGLPVWNLRDELVHTISSTTSKPTAQVKRHRLDVNESDTGTVAGFRCTNFTRTLFDLTRIAPLETALGCADAALKQLTRIDRHGSLGRTVNADAWEKWRDSMNVHAVHTHPRSHGLRNVRRIIELADPRADSVLESVSRLQLIRLGYDVELQVPVESPNGSNYYIDFELQGLGIYGECDGDVKYRDPAMLGTNTPADAVIREKQRDNWISGRTGHRMVHWGARDVVTPEAFATLLGNYHVPSPRRL